MSDVPGVEDALGIFDRLKTRNVSGRETLSPD